MFERAVVFSAILVLAIFAIATNSYYQNLKENNQTNKLN